MDEDWSSTVITDLHYKNNDDAELLPEVSSDATEDMYVDASDHTEENKDKDLEESAHPEFPGDVPKYNEVAVALSINQENT